MYYKTILFTFLCGIPIISLANCPSPSTVVFSCGSGNGQMICSWISTTGWYEGSGDPTGKAQPGDTASAFQSVIWMPYPNPDSKNGTTTCFYVSSFHEPIMLFQQTGYGTVPPPKGPLWTPFSSDSKNGLTCSQSENTCHFNFGD